MHQTECASSTLCKRFVRQVPPVAGSEPDNREDALRRDQLREPRKRSLRVHVVQSGHRHDRIERSGFEWNTEDVAVNPRDVGIGVTRPRAFENAGIEIEADDVRSARSGNLGRQNSVTTPHVEDVFRRFRNGVEDQGVVVDVGIPEPVCSHSVYHLQSIGQAMSRFWLFGYFFLIIILVGFWHFAYLSVAIRRFYLALV